MKKIIKQYTDRFLHLSESELKAIADSVDVRIYRRNKQIITLNDIEPCIIFIAKGIARRYFYDGKREQNIQIAKEGSIVFSAAAFVHRETSKYIVETIEPAMIYCLDKYKMDKICASYPQLHTLTKLILSEVLLQYEITIANNMYDSPRNRFLRFMHNHPDLLLRVPQKHLASYLQITPETFSRMKNLLYSKKGGTVP